MSFKVFDSVRLLNGDILAVVKKKVGSSASATIPIGTRGVVVCVDRNKLPETEKVRSHHDGAYWVRFQDDWGRHSMRERDLEKDSKENPLVRELKAKRLELEISANNPLTPRVKMPNVCACCGVSIQPGEVLTYNISSNVPYMGVRVSCKGALPLCRSCKPTGGWFKAAQTKGGMLLPTIGPSYTSMPYNREVIVYGKLHLNFVLAFRALNSSGSSDPLDHLTPTDLG